MFNSLFRLIAIAATIRIIFQLVASFMTNFTAFALLYAFGYGICNGLTYMVPMHHGWLWFPDKPGLISGIIIGGFGFGALVFAPIATALVNPDGEVSVNNMYSPEVNDRVPHMLLILDACFLGVCVVSWFLIYPGNDVTDIKKAVEKLEAPSLEIIEEELDDDPSRFSISEASRRLSE